MSGKPPHIVLIGDVGGASTFHVGDEAMLEANIVRLRRWYPGAALTVVSRDPAFTAGRYGVRCIEPMAFAAQRHDTSRRNEQMAAAVAAAQAHVRGDPAGQGAVAVLVDTLAQADALIVSGGGNLSSTWPHLLYERACLLRMAAALAVPSVLVGQTVGPNLTTGDRDLLAETLPLARLVGVREKPSALLAQSLGVPWSRILYQLDDCFDLPARPISDAHVLAGLDIGRQPLILVTMHPFAGPRPCRLLAQQLAALAAHTGAHLVFVPHTAGPDDHQPPADLAMGHRLCRFFTPETPFTLLDVRPGPELLWLTGQAEMVISTRYHPLVFATERGTPALGVYVDTYTRTKLRGALHHAGLEQWSLPVAAALDGRLLPAALELWQRRHEVRQHLAQNRRRWQSMQAQLEQRVTAALGLGPTAGAGRQTLLPKLQAAPQQPAPSPSGPWLADALLADGRHYQRQDEHTERRFAREQAMHDGDASSVRMRDSD